MPSRNRGKTWKTYRSGGRKNGVPWCYRHLWDKLRREGVVSCYMTAEERKNRDRACDKAIVEYWSPTRIKQFADGTPFSRTRIAALLAINRRSLRGLETGEYTPGPALCRRMAMLEKQAHDKTLYPEITPARAELRRRLLLFRAWWYKKPPSKESPRVTVRVSVEWGKGAHERMTLPLSLQARLVRFEGLVDVIKAHTKAMRSLITGFQRLNWTECEAEYWERWRDNTLPKIVTEREKIPAKMRAPIRRKRQNKRECEI